jgi:hypothetical protein
MNHSTLKKFAAKARVDLIGQASSGIRTAYSVELQEKRKITL